MSSSDAQHKQAQLDHVVSQQRGPLREAAVPAVLPAPCLSSSREHGGDKSCLGSTAALHRIGEVPFFSMAICDGNLEGPWVLWRLRGSERSSTEQQRASGSQ